MENYQGETRSKSSLPARAPLEEAPTVLSRNPIQIDSDLLRSATPAGDLPTPAASEDRTHVSAKTPDSSGSSIASANPLKMGQSLEGEQLGHFMLEKFVGGGGMGAVFRALDTMLGRVVAVKVLSRERTDADTLRRFKNEAQSAARLDHKNIARVHYVSEDAGWNYIVFEFIEGVNVRDLVERQGPLDLDDALNFTMQIAEALDHAAQREVVHRDIKPSNIIITPERRAKLVDMGLARLHQVESSHDDITASGVTLGTFDYISPEQARDPRAADVRSDIYSLGCTLYFMLCGRPPFPDGTVLQKLLSHNSDRPPDLRRFRPDLPDDMVEVVNRMLAKQPSQRYQTPAELMTALVMLAQKYQLTTVAPPANVWAETKPVPVPAWERHIPWIAPVVILLLTVVIMEWGFPPVQPDLNKLQTATPVQRATNGQAASEQPVVQEPGHSAPVQPAVVSPTEREAADTPVPATNNGSSLPETTVNATTRTPVDRGQTPAAAENEPPAPAPAVSPRPTETPATPTVEPATSPPQPAPARANVIVISRGEKTDAQITTLLQDALDRAMASDVIDQVELDFDGVVVLTEPLVVNATAVEINAAEGRQPELRFSPANLISTPAMLAIASGTFALNGVRLTLSVAEELSAADGWAMIAATSNVHRIELNDCLLTFDNPIAYLYDDESAFVRLERTTQLTGNALAAEPLLTAGEFDLAINRSIARGEATFFRAAHGVSGTLTWNQGMLATSERLLDIENRAATAESTTVDRPFRLSLMHVTAVADKGICRIGSNSLPQSIPVPLNVELNSCVVRTSPDVPLFDQLGVDPTSDDPTMLFTWDRSGTRFSRTRSVHRFAGEIVGERLRTDSMQWENALPIPSTKPWHEHVVADYLVAGEEAENPPGFDPELLPSLSSTSAADSAPPPKSTTSE